MILDVSGNDISVATNQFNGPVTINNHPGELIKI
jgi:hypothetical protein